MSEIRIIVKPDTVSYEAIRDIIQLAHKENISNGIIMKTTTFSTEQLAETLRKDNATCFVAMDGNKPVGTTSCCVQEKKTWYCHNKTMKWMLLGILPEYRGQGIYGKLVSSVENKAQECGCDTVFFDTAERNTHMIDISKKKGYVCVDFFRAKLGHYSVIMMKWLDGCPFSVSKCRYRFMKKKILVKLCSTLRRIKGSDNVGKTE